MSSRSAAFGAYRPPAPELQKPNHLASTPGRNSAVVRTYTPASSSGDCRDIMKGCVMERLSRARAFTAVDLLVVVVVVTIIAAILLPALGQSRVSSRQIRDSTQIRGIHQGMVLWVQGNADSYPRPSRFDKSNDTVSDQGAAKDTTANIVSILIFSGFIGPELCISTAESNPGIRVCGTYSYSNPSAAVNPAKALWDPSFSTDYTGGKTGSFSCAHTLPADERLATWANTFNAAEAAICNRGPEISGMSTHKKQRTFATATPGSNTYLIHGGRSTWEGNISYNDNHVSFETRIDPETSPYKDAAGTEWFDCLFFDEPDDSTLRNNYLGNFIKAGATKSEFKSIWD